MQAAIGGDQGDAGRKRVQDAQAYQPWIEHHAGRPQAQGLGRPELRPHVAQPGQPLRSTFNPLAVRACTYHDQPEVWPLARDERGRLDQKTQPFVAIQRSHKHAQRPVAQTPALAKCRHISGSDSIALGKQRGGVDGVVQRRDAIGWGAVLDDLGG